MKGDYLNSCAKVILFFGCASLLGVAAIKIFCLIEVCVAARLFALSFVPLRCTKRYRCHP